MGRVKLTVEADTNGAIENIAKLGTAIDNAVKKFDSKAVTTWETTASEKIQKVVSALGGIVSKYGEVTEVLQKSVEFGIVKAITDAKTSFETLVSDSKSAFDKVKSNSNGATESFKTLSAGIVAESEKAKTAIQQVAQALNELNTAKAGSKISPNTATAKNIETLSNAVKNAQADFETFKTIPTQIAEVVKAIAAQLKDIKAPLSEISKAVAAVNTTLAKVPKLGLRQALKDFRLTLTSFRKSITSTFGEFDKGAKAAVSAVKLMSTSIAEIIDETNRKLASVVTVLNAVSQKFDTKQIGTKWADSIKTSAAKVVEELGKVKEAFKNVRADIKSPMKLGLQDSVAGTNKEMALLIQKVDKLAKGFGKGLGAVRTEIEKTRNSARSLGEEIRRAISGAMTGEPGTGGSKGGGGGSGRARLGFMEQFWSRMRSNVYSYLTMWFGIGGAIRAANELLQVHNSYLESGKKLSQDRYQSLGELSLKAGVNFKEYQTKADELVAKGMFGGDAGVAYRYMSSAAMSGISATEAAGLSEIFGNNIVAEQDQRALMQLVGYIRANGYTESVDQIIAMALQANAMNPSNLSPTANAIIKNIEMYKAFNMPLEKIFAIGGLGGAKQKDLVASTMQRAFFNKVRQEGMEAMVYGDIYNKEYYYDKARKEYRFKNEADQKWFEEAKKNGEELVSVEMFSQWAAGKGSSIRLDLGGSMRALLGADFFRSIGENTDAYMKLLEQMTAIKNGDLSVMNNALKNVQQDTSAQTVIGAAAAEAISAQAYNPAANITTNLESVRKIYERVGWGTFGNLFGRGIDFTSWTNEAKTGRALEYAAAIQRSTAYNENDKQQARNIAKLAVKSYIEAYAQNFRIDLTKKENIGRVKNAVGSVMVMMADEGGMTPGMYLAQDLEKEITEELIEKTVPPVTKTAKMAVPSVFDKGKTYENKARKEEEEAKAEEAKAKADKKATAAAERERKAAELESKRKEQEEASYAKAALDALPKWSIRTKENEFIKTAYSDVSSDMSADLQALKPYALGSEIGAKSDSNKVLSKAFYAYASDMTDAATDKEIVKQMVGAMLAAGMNKEGIGNLVNAYWEEMRLNNAANIRSEDNRNAINNFQQAVLELLSSLNDEAKKGNEPPVNPAASRPAPATAAR